MTSKKLFRAGQAATTLATLFLVWDGIIKLLVIDQVVEAFERLNVPVNLARGIGLLELVCTALYLVPRTAALGAVLLSAFLGGAVCLHLRIGDPLLSHILFPTYVGMLVWLGLYVRDPRLRALFQLAERS